MNKFFICSSAACAERIFDCQKIHRYLIKNKWLKVESISEADLVIINTCSFSRYEDVSSLQLIKYCWNKKPKSSKLIIAGCMPKINPRQLEGIGDFLAISPTELDRLDDLLKAEAKFKDIEDPNLFSRKEVSYRPIFKKILNISALFVPSALKGPSFEHWGAFLRRAANQVFSAAFSINPLLVNKREKFYYLRISNGCLGGCSYCAKRAATGTLRSKPVDTIISEFMRGLEFGHKDFFLLTEDSGCYGIDIGTTIVNLLKALFEAGRRSDYKLAVSNFNAHWFVKYYEDLRTLFIENRENISYIQMPIQSASNRILKLMNRPYCIEEVEKVLWDIKRECSSLCITTDMIVGFPGETEEEFNLSKEFVKRIDFSFVDVFGYEDRPNTVSSAMSGKLPQAVIDRRALEMSKVRKSKDKLGALFKKSLELVSA